MKYDDFLEWFGFASFLVGLPLGKHYEFRLVRPRHR
jgi:hypothetical protein